DEDLAARRVELAAAAGLASPELAAAERKDRRATTARQSPARKPTPTAVDPAARAAIRLAPLDRARFDDLRIATALASAGLDEPAIARTRLALGLPTPRATADAAALVTAWLADPDVRALLQ